jgi:hypothetical protein
VIEHESDLWAERRWAIADSEIGDGVRAFPFRSEYERKHWITSDTLGDYGRRAVGKRHPAVKALRQQWRQEALRKLAEWKEQYR